MQLSRRGFFSGLVALVAAPAIVRVESLMVLPAPAKIILPEGLVKFTPIETAVEYATHSNLLTINQITREAVRLFQNSNSFIRSMNARWQSDFAFANGARESSYQWKSHVQAMRPSQLSFAEWSRKMDAVA